MKDYQREGIEDGEAYNARKNPEITRKLWEDGIGFMRDVFDDIDLIIDQKVHDYSIKGVWFYADVEASIAIHISRNIAKYLKSHIEKFKEELSTLNNQDNE